MSKNYVESDIDQGIEVWQLNDIETWVGWGFDDIVKKAIEQTGVPREELLDEPYKITRDKWDRSHVMEPDTDFRPRYTYSNMIVKDMMENVEMPYLLCGTEF